jgi:hypothetical protein
VKVLVEEIVKYNPSGKPGERYRRSTIGLLEVPDNAGLSVGGELIVTGGFKRADDERHALKIARMCGAVLEETYIGLIIDLVDPELYRWIDEDNDAPADYLAFCEQEGLKL